MQYIYLVRPNEGKPWQVEVYEDSYIIPQGASYLYLNHLNSDLEDLPKLLTGAISYQERKEKAVEILDNIVSNSENVVQLNEMISALLDNDKFDKDTAIYWAGVCFKNFYYLSKQQKEWYQKDIVRIKESLSSPTYVGEPIVTKKKRFDKIVDHLTMAQKLYWINLYEKDLIV